MDPSFPYIPTFLLDCGTWPLDSIPSNWWRKKYFFIGVFGSSFGKQLVQQFTYWMKHDVTRINIKPTAVKDTSKSTTDIFHLLHLFFIISPSSSAVASFPLLHPPQKRIISNTFLSDISISRVKGDNSSAFIVVYMVNVPLTYLSLSLSFGQLLHHANYELLHSSSIQLLPTNWWWWWWFCP